MRRQQSAAALITALLVVAIVATVATMLAISERAAIQDSSLFQQNLQARLNTQGLSRWAQQRLSDALHQNKALALPLTEVLNKDFHGAAISASLSDANARFNINALANLNQREFFARLLVLLVPELKPNQAKTIADNISNWVRPSSADAVYLKRKPAYRAAHLPMANISELKRVAGVTPKIYQALAPYVIALPNSENKLNLLHIKRRMIQALGPDIRAEQVEKLLACQKQASSQKNPGDYMKSCLNNLQIKTDPAVSLLTSSQYFLLKGRIKYPKRELIYHSLLQRQLKNNRLVRVKQLWQTMYFE